MSSAAVTIQTGRDDEFGAPTAGARLRSGTLSSPKRVFNPRAHKTIPVKPDLSKCKVCDVKFTIFNHRHMCRKCQEPVCNPCARNRLALQSYAPPKRVCDTCVDKFWKPKTNPDSSGTTESTTTTTTPADTKPSDRLSLTLSTPEVEDCSISARKQMATISPGTPYTPAGFFGPASVRNMNKPHRRQVSMAVPELLASPAMLPPLTPAERGEGESSVAVTTSAPTLSPSLSPTRSNSGWGSFFGGRQEIVDGDVSKAVVQVTVVGEEVQKSLSPHPSVVAALSPTETALMSPAATVSQEKAKAEKSKAEVKVEVIEGEVQRPPFFCPSAITAVSPSEAALMAPAITVSEEKADAEEIKATVQVTAIEKEVQTSLSSYSSAAAGYSPTETAVVSPTVIVSQEQVEAEAVVVVENVNEEVEHEGEHSSVHDGAGPEEEGDVEFEMEQNKQNFDEVESSTEQEGEEFAVASSLVEVEMDLGSCAQKKEDEDQNEVSRTPSQPDKADDVQCASQETSPSMFEEQAFLDEKEDDVVAEAEEPTRGDIKVPDTEITARLGWGLAALSLGLVIMKVVRYSASLIFY